jgi:hypothetical protein
VAGSGAREGRSPLVRSAVIRVGRAFAHECGRTYTEEQ